MGVQDGIPSLETRQDSPTQRVQPRLHESFNEQIWEDLGQYRDVLATLGGRAPETVINMKAQFCPTPCTVRQILQQGE